MKFKYNERVFEVPEGVDVEVEVDDEHVDFNFVLDGDWGEHIAMLGGTDESGALADSWESVGIRELT